MKNLMAMLVVAGFMALLTGFTPVQEMGIGKKVSSLASNTVEALDMAGLTLPRVFGYVGGILDK